MSRIFTTSVASVYPHYVTKVERKGRTKAELDEVIGWLTGFDRAELDRHLAGGTTFEDFFAAAELNPDVSLITGSVCGVRVQEVEDPLMRRIRYLDKARGRAGQGQADGEDPAGVSRGGTTAELRVVAGQLVSDLVVAGASAMMARCLFPNATPARR